MIRLIIKLFSLGAILTIPSLSFAQPVLCSVSGSVPSGTTLSAGSTVYLYQALDGSPEQAVFDCPGVTFLGIGAFQPYQLSECCTGTQSDYIELRNNAGSATITFNSYPDPPCPPGPPFCLDIETEASLIAPAQFNGSPIEFSFVSGGATMPPNTTDSVSLTAVTPEPATFATFGTGLLALIGFLRRKLP